jgi:hypothetical protein
VVDVPVVGRIVVDTVTAVARDPVVDDRTDAAPLDTPVAVGGGVAEGEASIPSSAGDPSSRLIKIGSSRATPSVKDRPVRSFIATAI